jgi:hypothetical protein
VCWSAAVKAETDPQPGAASSSQPSADADVAREQPPLEHRVEAFVRAMSKNPEGGQGDSLVRWSTPICPLVVGLPAADTKTVSERLARISASVGAPFGLAPCKSNFVIIATAEPDKVLEAWYARDKRLFGEATPAQIHQFLDSSASRPVRVWYNIDAGRKSGTHNGHFVPSNQRAESSAFVGNTVCDFFSVFAIIDTHRTDRTALEALADYVSLLGLTNINADAALEGAPSILHLFAAPGEERPTGLSSWDAAFLRAVYQSNQTSRTRRFDIAERMIHDLER